MAKKKGKWIQEHLNDKFVKLSFKENLKSRASYKLKQINDKYKVLKEGDVAIDLGAAPGGWSQIAKSIVKEKGHVIAIDLLAISGVPNVTIITGDIFSEEILNKCEGILKDFKVEKVDLVMSDMAPNLSGIASLDSARAYELNSRALYYAERYLKKGGDFVIKVFRNEYFDKFCNEAKKAFSACSIYKPEASRTKSSEIYLVLKNKLR